ncbi:MAG: molybdopterin-guanine dinucleotide biosynthesis protein B [Candidatus Pacebacteria bacterium]|nr:molybdopterin-guanine dinucleotide biosynthesis protein B [Candidatus Paceibacterota bacterium]
MQQSLATMALPCLGICGWSGAGKTTLITAMVPILRQAGLSVSVIKHAHHGFDIDRAGKDSYRHRAAGATEVMLASSERWALLHELATAGESRDEPNLPELLARMTAVDLVLAEGFRNQQIDKIEVFRPSLNKELWALQDNRVIAVASDDRDAGVLQQTASPILDLNRPEQVAEFVQNWRGG